MSKPDLVRRALLLRLWNNGSTYEEIAAIYGGTENGVRSTIRKMRERGEFPDRICCGAAKVKRMTHGKTFSGVSTHFYASHEDPKGIKPVHGHTWHVKAWFPAKEDGRDLLLPLQALADQLNETHIPELWGEGIASSFGRRLNGCVAVDVWREDQPFQARWEL